MNDPHVSVLIYQVRHDETVNYHKASLLEYETTSFKVSVKNCEARFEMKEHFPTAGQAREVVEPFIRQWEFATALDRDPGEFELVFLGAVVEDRKPTPGVVALEGAFTGSVAGSVSIVVGRATYPDPPTNIKIDANVEEMARHYSRYREGKETLAAMAYYCLTVLEQASDAGRRPGRLARRTAIQGKFGIEVTVTDMLGDLSSERGGTEARKAEGRSNEYTANQRNWIEQATKRMIRRAAEVAHDPAVAASQIAMSDLPKLQ
jgi:hypothetical protein